MSSRGWGEALFLKDIWPQAALLPRLEFFYQPHGSDVGFDSEYSRQRSVDPWRLRIRNTNHVLALEMSDAVVCPTHFQASTIPT